jgi:hypothetical protein
MNYKNKNIRTCFSQQIFFKKSNIVCITDLHRDIELLHIELANIIDIVVMMQQK